MTKKDKITITDIARLSSTSKTTVSFYLNQKFDKMSDETRQRIARVIKETNYSPHPAARSLNAKSMKLIGVLIGDITNDFANKIVKGIETIAKNQNYQLLMGNTNYDPQIEKDYVNRMLEMGVDGFIVQPTVHFSELDNLIASHGKKLVFIDSQIETENSTVVKVNNHDAVYKTTMKLIDAGYEEFVMFTADPSVLSTRLERTEGFKQALDECKLPYRVNIINENDVESGLINDVIRDDLKINKKTLIFTANCWLLPPVFMALKNLRNLMPETIGLFGFDNTEWTEFVSPSITTIVQPAYNEGRRAAEILIELIEEKHDEVRVEVLDCDVNWQDSTLK